MDTHTQTPGPVVEVSEDAPVLDRVVGLSGREPGWTA